MKKMNEEWKSIFLNGCNLEVSNCGNVRFAHNKKPKAFHLNRYGYPTIHIMQCKKVFAYRIHRLVALLFIENPCPEKYDCVNHKDENPSNNHIDNLEWCDRAYNNRYGGHNKRVADAHSIPVMQYDLDGNFIKEWKSATDVSRTLGIPQQSINSCCLRKPKYNSSKGFIWRYKSDKTEVVYKNGKPIIMMDKDGNTIKEYPNLTEASKDNNILITSITNCLKGRSKNAGGFVWKYKE